MSRVDDAIVYAALLLTFAAICARIWAPQFWPILAAAALAAAFAFAWRQTRR